MYFAVGGSKLPSHLSPRPQRKEDDGSALLGWPETGGHYPTPVAWALRTSRRLRVLLMTILLTTFFAFHLDIFHSSGDYAVAHRPNSTAAEGSADAPSAIPEKHVASTVLAATDKEAFIDDIISSDIRGVYDGQSLYKLCSSKRIKWDDKLVFECPTIEGGYSTVRNAALTCLRLTIEAGGSLVLPQITARNPRDPSDFRTNDLKPMSYLFDTAHFKSVLAAYCPKLKIHDAVPDEKQLPGIPKRPVTLTPYHLPNITRAGPLITNPSHFRKSFQAWLDVLPNHAATAPVRIGLSREIIWTWPTSYDPSAFTRSFSGVLRLSPALRSHGAEALHALVTTHLTPSSFSALPPSPAPFALPFIGIHLRAGQDATQDHLTNYTLQTGYYLSRLQSDLLRGPASTPLTIYLAAGDAQQTTRFARALTAALAPRPVRVATKASLLPRDVLRPLAWDQGAALDRAVLERAAYVLGPRDSAFAWALALGRAAAANWVVGGFPAGPCRVPDEEREGEEEEGVEGATDGAAVGDERKKGEAKASGRRRGCRKDLAPYEYWRDELSALAGDLGPAKHESVDVIRSSVWP